MILDSFNSQTELLMHQLEKRSTLMLQMEDYIYTASKNQTNHLLQHSSILIISFSILFFVVVLAFGVYLRLLFRSQKELSMHRDQLSKLVEQRTAELTSTNELLLSEIGEHKKTEELLRTTVHEKETLLKEVYHRVKNNLNMVNSLISLQKNDLQPELLSAFNDLENRITAISMIHEKLYRSADLTGIDFKEYIGDLARSLVYSLSKHPGSIKVTLEAPHIALPADKLIPLGLITTEIITNSIKHGFPPHSNNEIFISAHTDDGKLHILIGDDGLPPESESTILQSHSLGALLIQSLSKQLGGSFELSLKGGTSYSFCFPLDSFI